MALDYGTKTIGVAVSDETGRIALPLEVIRRESEIAIKKSVSRLGEIIKEYNISEIVIGSPLMLNGTQSAMSQKAAEFKERLRRNFKRMNIIMWDERLSTVQATRALREANAPKGAAAAVVDQTAATLILQAYLELINNKNP